MAGVEARPAAPEGGWTVTLHVGTAEAMP